MQPRAAADAEPSMRAHAVKRKQPLACQGASSLAYSN